MLSCLLVIPHYRDTERLKPYLAELIKTLPDFVTIQVSDDGSGAESFHNLKVLIECSKKYRLHLKNGPKILSPIKLEKNQGKGSAVLEGWKQNSGEDFLAFVDADGAVSVPELLRALSYMKNVATGLDILIGSRIKMAGRRVERRLIRHLSGRLFATFVSLILKIDIYDTQCGLKILRRSVYERISPKMQTSGFAFDVELLVLATKMGFIIEEFPVDWRDIPGSKVTLLKHSLPMMKEVYQVKRRLDRLSLPLSNRDSKYIS